MFHYGWALSPAELKAKTLALAALYHGGTRVARRWGAVPPAAGQRGGRVALAWPHPAVMRRRMARRGWPAPDARRPLLDTPLLNPSFYGAWLGKWGLVPRRWWL